MRDFCARLLPVLMAMPCSVFNGARQGAAFYRAADAIQDTHWCRKSNILKTAQKTKRSGGKCKLASMVSSDQLDFDL
jgi:hypothetical protein